MRLYHHPVSIDCRKVRVVAAELGMILELVSVPDNEPRLEPLSEIPRSRIHVPSLVDGDAVVSVPNAILQYLAERRPHVSLWPESSTLRAGIARWQLWEATDFGPAVRELVSERLRQPENDVLSSVVGSQAEMWFHCFAAVLENHLQTRDYLVGEQPTLADFSVVAPLSLTEAAHLPLTRYPHIRMWRERLEARPSMRSLPPCAPS